MLAPVDIPPGFVRQETPYEMPSRWWDGNLVRWSGGSIAPIGGNTKLSNAASVSTIRRLYQWKDNDSNEFIAVGGGKHLYVWTDSLKDITPAGFVGPDESTVGTAGFGAGVFGGAFNFGQPQGASQPQSMVKPYHWTFDNYGQDLYAVASSDGRLLHWTPSLGVTVLADVIATAPLSLRAVSVTAERAIMVVRNRDVAWCSLENPNDWDFASTSNTAGFLPLDGSSDLITARRCKDGTLVLSGDQAWLIRYVGLPSIYGKSSLGRITFQNPLCIAHAGDAIMWLGLECFWIYDGGQVKPLPCELFSDLKQRMDPTYGPYRAFMSNHGQFPEVWLFYPSVGQTECDSYLVYNYELGIWFWGSMSRTAWTPAKGSTYPYSGKADGFIYTQEQGYTDNGASRVGQVWIESSIIEGKAADPPGKNVLGAQIATDPDISGGNVAITIKTRRTPNGPETSFGPYTPRSDGFTDARANGRDIRMRLSALADSAFGVGTVFLDVRPDGAKR